MSLQENTTNLRKILNAVKKLPSAGGGEEEVNKLASVIDRTVTEITAEDLAGATNIGSYAFYQCKSLTSVVIPDGVTTIGAYAVANCDNLNSITIPESVITISSNVFISCTALRHIYITDIASWCNITFGYLNANPMYATNGGSTLYLNGKAVTDIVIPNTVTALKPYVFSNFKKMTSISIPESVTSIGNSALYQCENLTSISIPESVTSIGNSALYQCKGLTSVTIPSGVTSISESLFYGCSKLTSVVVLGSVITSVSVAFSYCTALKRVDFSKASKVPTLQYSNTFNNIPCQIKVPTNLIDEWKSATNWSTFADKIVTEFTNEL